MGTTRMTKISVLYFLILARLAICQEEGCELNLVATEVAQTVSTPNYPDNYGRDLQCTWVIFAGHPESQVEVEFDQILTETCCDYIEVRDGFSSDSPFVGSYRGNISGCSHVSTFGALYITFVSDESIQDVGFQFRYALATANQSCGNNELEARPRTLSFAFTPPSLTSPGWPSNYPGNVICTWIITAEEGYQTVLEMRIVQLAKPCDNLQVRDGTNETSPLLAPIRQRRFGSNRIASSNRVLHVRFRSDKVGSANGFLALYYSLPNENIRVIRLEQPERECGGELETPAQGHGNISSPGFPGRHAGNLECVWIIRAPERERVRLYFTFVNTETCCDWIKVRDGPNFDSRKIAVLSGLRVNFHSFLSTSNVMRVEFDTDMVISSRGFSAFYEIYREGADELESRCGGTYTADDTLQYISSPNWPAPYESSHSCIWIIGAQALETRVRLHILGILTESFFDHVLVYDGNLPLARNRIIFLSGIHYQRYIITSSGPFLTVQFTSDTSFHRGGFRASYRQVPAS